jgi:hypothetical protein
LIGVSEEQGTENMSSDASETNAQDGTAHAEAAAHREAFEYWGYLIQPDKCGTSLFNRLLEGIAEIIVSPGLLVTEQLQHLE